MIKKLLKIFLTYFFLIFSANAEIVKEIEVNGNKRISKETIIILGAINLGQDYNNSDLNNIFKNIFESNFFENIQINLKDNLLSINVVENPIIEQIEISGIKRKSLVEVLRERISLKERMSFTESQLSRDVKIIENHLKTNGYYFSKVSPTIEMNNDLNSLRLNINVELGEKAKIKKIKFIGNKKIKDKRLLEVIASEEHKFWKFVSNKVYLNSSLIDLDKRLLSNYYKNLGYKNVKVFESFAEFTTKGDFEITFNIDAGKKFYFNQLTLNLPSDYDKEKFSNVEKIFNKFKGEHYSLNGLKKIIDEIDNIASAKLYDFIDAKVTENIVNDNQINLLFNIIDSEKFYVERINILGNFNTEETVIRNKLIVDEGDPLNKLLYQKSLDNIKSLNIFKIVDANVKDGSNKNLKEIDIIVEERPTGEISLAAGVGTNGTTIGGGLTEKNFLGQGINVSSNLEISEDSVKGYLDYARPNFRNSDNTLFTSIRSTSKDRLTNFGYKDDNMGFSIGTEFEQYENLFFNPELDLNFQDLETNSTATKSIKDQAGTYQDFYFNYSFSYDLRNSNYKPSSGSKTIFRQELPVISDNNEISNTFVHTKYKTLNNETQMVGKASFYFKAVNSLDSSDVRISKRAQVPYHRLRGFEKGKVGPMDVNNDYVGGNYVSALNLSTNIPTIFPTVENIDFNYFIDFANIWGIDFNDALDDSSKIRSSTGIGLDLLTPVGPFNFSITTPITKNSTDKTETFRFNLGTTF